MLGLIFLKNIIKTVDIVALLCYYNSVRRVTGNTVASARKETNMEEMNMCETLVQQSQENMARKILEMLNKSKDLEDAIKKVEALLEK